MIIYEDNHLLALNKPAGILTQPSGTSQKNLEEIGKSLIQTKFLEAVHRLDKPVSGVVLFAKTKKALSRLQEAMREKQTKKIYLAAVSGNPPNDEVLTHFLLKGEHKTRVVTSKTPGAKKAILHLRKKDHLLEIELITGRYHQIRAQLSHIGCPIIGDVKYGSPVKLKEDIIALHHQTLHLVHPVQLSPLTLEAPLPPYFPKN
ncbi:MAG: RluA family pseudouridine synthase [Waddliaceae bacterium]